MTRTSKDLARAAVTMAMTADREGERAAAAQFAVGGIRCAAVDIGGEYAVSVNKAVERAVVAARREGLIADTHQEEGSVAGATHEAMTQLISRALGMNIGGKIGLARADGHVVVAAFLGIGLLHLNDVGISLGHRAV